MNIPSFRLILGPNIMNECEECNECNEWSSGCNCLSVDINVKL